MKKVVSAEMMREIDRVAISEIGIPGVILMENAGLAVVNEITKRTSSLHNINIFAGKGNNGGDGFVIARHMKNLGAEPTVFLVANKNEVKGDAKINLDAFENIGGRVKEITESRHLKNFKLKFLHTNIVVDALLGTGLKSEPTGIYAEVIDVMNKHGKFKIAVDIPSGLSADSGVVPGVAFNADTTVTFGATKLGLHTYPAAINAGKVIVADISIPVSVIDNSPSEIFIVEQADVKERLPSRAIDGHKGSFGHLLLACGSAGMGGAGLLAGLAAARCGVGLVTVGLPQSLTSAYLSSAPELMTIPLPETDEGAIDGEAADAFLAKLNEGCSAVLIGPGLRQGDGVKEFVRKVLAESKSPLLLDADGLNVMGEESGWIAKREAPTIVTPHPGEMARLTGLPTSDIQANRLDVTKEYAAKTGAVVVLKGAGTVIADSSGKAWINPTGNHGLATGGSGDVLSGMIGSFLAQGALAIDASICGAYLHGKTADLWSESGNDPRSLIASDLIDLIPETFQVS